MTKIKLKSKALGRMETFAMLQLYCSFHTSDFQINELHFFYNGGILTAHKFHIKMILPTGRPVPISWNYFPRSLLVRKETMAVSLVIIKITGTKINYFYIKPYFILFFGLIIRAVEKVRALRPERNHFNTASLSEDLNPGTQ
jgi:hypothetical protein